MNESSARVDDLESAYQLVLSENWSALLSFIHRHRAEHSDSDRLDHLTDVFLSAFFASLAQDSARGQSIQDNKTADLAERILLFHLSGQIRLTAHQFRTTVLGLVSFFEGVHNKAVSLAQFLPEDPTCARVIAEHGTPKKRYQRPLEHANITTIQPDSVPVTARDRTLLKSDQEVRFFQALQNVFPNHLVFPNVALQTLISFERVQEFLSSRDREYFFRGLVDFALFQREERYPAVAVFELDSPLHDDDTQESKDDMKNRILSRGGISLIRIRPHRAGMSVTEMEHNLKDLIERGTINVAA